METAREEGCSGAHRGAHAQPGGTGEGHRRPSKLNLQKEGGGKGEGKEEKANSIFRQFKKEKQQTNKNKEEM